MLTLLLLSLSIIGLAALVTKETGPYHIFEVLREISHGYSCIYCTTCQICLVTAPLTAFLLDFDILHILILIGLPQAILRVSDFISETIRLWLMK